MDRAESPAAAAPLERRREADRQPRVPAVASDVLVSPNQSSLGGILRGLEVLDMEGDVDVLRALEEVLVILLLAGREPGIHATNGADLTRLDRARVGFDDGGDVRCGGRTLHGRR